MPLRNLEDFQKTKLNLTIAKITEPESKDIDLLWTEFILCHQGSNLNQDYFLDSILEEYHQTICNKPINWEHGQPVIGHVVASEIGQEPSGRKFVKAGGYLYRYIYPNLINQIVSRYENDECRVSMELYFKDADYWVGEGEEKQIYNYEEAEALGILERVGGSYDGKPVFRVFKPPIIFGGVGIVANPADVDAWMLKIASQQLNAPGGLDRLLNDLSKDQLKQILHSVLHYQYEVEEFVNIPKELVIEMHKHVHVD